MRSSISAEIKICHGLSADDLDDVSKLGQSVQNKYQICGDRYPGRYQSLMRKTVCIRIPYAYALLAVMVYAFLCNKG